VETAWQNESPATRIAPKALGTEILSKIRPAGGLDDVVAEIIWMSRGKIRLKLLDRNQQFLPGSDGRWLFFYYS
jgi:hypothetical protein